MWMYLYSNGYNILSALIMHEIDLTYMSIPHIYKCFVFHVFFLIIIIIFFVIRQIAVFEIQYLRKVTGIRRLVYVSLLLYLFQSTSLLIYNSPRTPYGSMNSWKYCMKTLTNIDSWFKIEPGCNWWAFVNGIAVKILYTVVYRVFVENNQISGNIHTNLAPSWPELHVVSHKESIAQWYHIPGYQVFISLYMCHFAYIPVAGNVCLTFNIMTAMAWMLGGLSIRLSNRRTVVFLLHDIQELTKKLSCVTPIPNRNILRFRLYRYHVPVDVTMVSIALPISFCWRELRYQDRTGYHIETTNDLPIPSVKHVKHNAKE